MESKSVRQQNYKIYQFNFQIPDLIIKSEEKNKCKYWEGVLIEESSLDKNEGDARKSGVRIAAEEGAYMDRETQNGLKWIMAPLLSNLLSKSKGRILKLPKSHTFADPLFFVKNLLPSLILMFYTFSRPGF